MPKKDKLGIEFLASNKTTSPHKTVKSPKANSMPNITKQDFISWFSKALDEEVVIEKLKGVLEASVEEIQNRVDDIELQNEDRDERTRSLQG